MGGPGADLGGTAATGRRGSRRSRRASAELSTGVGAGRRPAVVRVRLGGRRRRGKSRCLRWGPQRDPPASAQAPASRNPRGSCANLALSAIFQTRRRGLSAVRAINTTFCTFWRRGPRAATGARVSERRARASLQTVWESTALDGGGRPPRQRPVQGVADAAPAVSPWARPAAESESGDDNQSKGATAGQPPPLPQGGIRMIAADALGSLTSTAVQICLTLTVTAGQTGLTSLLVKMV